LKKADVRKMFDEKGNHRGIHELDDVTAMAVKGYDFVTLYEGEGEQKHAFGLRRKVRLIDKLAVRSKLGEHFGLFDKKPQVQVNILNEFYLRSKEELQILHTTRKMART